MTDYITTLIRQHKSPADVMNEVVGILDSDSKVLQQAFGQARGGGERDADTDAGTQRDRETATERREAVGANAKDACGRAA